MWPTCLIVWSAFHNPMDEARDLYKSFQPDLQWLAKAPPAVTEASCLPSRSTAECVQKVGLASRRQ